MDDYDDAEESDQGAPIYNEDPYWTPEDVDEAVRQHGGCVRKCLTILFHFTSSFVSFITFFFFVLF